MAGALRRQCGLGHELALAGRPGEPLCRRKRRGLAGHDGRGLRPLRRGGADRARALAADLEGVPHTGARDRIPGIHIGTGHSGRRRADRPPLLSQREQRPPVHLLHGRRSRDRARTGLLHERVRRHVAGASARLAGLRRRAPAPPLGLVRPARRPAPARHQVGAARGRGTRGRRGARAPPPRAGEPGDPAVLRRCPRARRLLLRPRPRLTRGRGAAGSRGGLADLRRRASRAGPGAGVGRRRRGGDRVVPPGVGTGRWEWRGGPAIFAGRRSGRPRAHGGLPVPDRALASYAGDYRERTVMLRGGRLHYGGGADPESPLVPMGPDLFELERDPAVRVRFIGDGVRPAAELVAIYRDGSVDRWSRR